LFQPALVDRVEGVLERLAVWQVVGQVLDQRGELAAKLDVGLEIARPRGVVDVAVEQAMCRAVGVDGGRQRVLADRFDVVP
jgi:hypothetical protein